MVNVVEIYVGGEEPMDSILELTVSGQVMEVGETAKSDSDSVHYVVANLVVLVEGAIKDYSPVILIFYYEPEHCKDQVFYENEAPKDDLVGESEVVIRGSKGN